MLQMYVFFQTFMKCWFVLKTGKKKRLTIMECNNDINSMIDVAKVADLVSNII